MPSIDPPDLPLAAGLRARLLELAHQSIRHGLGHGRSLPVEPAGLETLALFDDPFLLAMPASAELEPSQALSGETLLLLEDGHCLRDQALEVCSRVGLSDEQDYRATSLETLRQMVAANAGITLMPELAITQRSGAVRYLPFSDDDPHRDIGLCWRVSSTRGDLLAQFARVLQEAMRGAVGG
jgi:LysR family hydrogen peroxide-inducible transcriptional activator